MLLMMGPGRRVGWFQGRLRCGFPVKLHMLSFILVLMGMVMLAASDAAEYTVPPGDTAALIRAIDNANDSRGADIIRLAAGRYEVTAVHNTTRGQNGLPVITSNITIEGEWLTDTVIVRRPSSERDDFVLFRVARQGRLTLKRLGLQDDNFWGNRSAVLNERGGNLTIEQCALTHLHNAVLNDGQATITGSRFERNTTEDDCAAIDNTSSGMLTLSKSGLIKNGGGDGGRAALCNAGEAMVSKVTFAGNQTVICGAISHSGGELTLTKSSIEGSANDSADAVVCLSGGRVTIAESTIARNQGGLGIWRDASVTVRKSTIAHHTDSAGIFVGCCEAEVTVEDSTITHNRSGENGGGIANHGDGEVVLKDTILTNNQAREDGPDCLGAVRVSGSTLIGDPSGCTVRGEQQCSSRGPLSVAGVTASGFQPDREPENTLDNNLGTRWSAHGRGEWIQFDLGSRLSFSEVQLAWFRGDRRRARFRIQVSDNARDWRLDLSRTSSGTTLELERYTFAAQTARYVRIIGNGNTDNDWNGMTEAKIVAAGIKFRFCKPL